MCTVIARLAKEQLEMFGLNVAFPAIVTDCGANMRKAFNNTLQWDWLRCGCHFIHNVVTAGLQHRGITRTIQPKLRPENVNKRLTGEKCELLLPNALVFFKIREKYLELGIKYLRWFYRARSFVSHAKRSSKVSKELRTLQKQ